jgi:hypothetical protein
MWISSDGWLGGPVLCGWSSGVGIHSLGVFEMKSSFCMIETVQCELIWRDRRVLEDCLQYYH